MRYVRRLGAALVTSLMVGALVATPASADTPERFVGNAAGRALGIKLLGTDLAFGDAKGLVNSTLDPVAKGAGQVLPSLVGATEATTSSGTKQDGETCDLPRLPDPLGSVIDLGVACSTSVASVIDGLKSTASNGYVASLGIDASSLLGALPLPDLTETLDQVTAPVLEVLQPVIDAVEEATGVQVDEAVETVGSLLEQLLSQKALEVTLGKAASFVRTEASKLTSLGTAQGATIKILPTSTLLGDIPLATITVGSSSATATYDRGTGKAVPSFDASLVTISVAALPGLTPAITQSVKPGQTITILEGTLLQSRITVADGRTESLPDGGVKAIADGVSVELLQGLNASSPTAFDGGVALQLAHSEAAVAGAPAVKTPTTPIVAGVQQLPRTGGTPWIPLAGIGVLGLFVATRRIAVRTSR
jgi:hypothetical protein